MLHRYEEITAEALAKLRPSLPASGGAGGRIPSPLGEGGRGSGRAGEGVFADPERAAAVLRALPGENVSDSAFERLLPSLLESLARSADPDRALVNLSAFLAHVGSRSMYFDLLAGHPAATDALLTLFAASQFLADILIRTPEYFEVIANPTIRDRPRGVDEFLADALRRIAIADTPGKKRDALRRFKPPEVLRIGARDILGYADLDQTIAEISDFAEACVRAAVEICCDGGAGEKFAVIGMGKLGGRELNYASDIDLIFVHADALDQNRANRLAEAVRDTLAKPTEAGFVFRVDLRLRPEGRFGAISRSLTACRNYYESWAEPWERQAMLKARPVGGDPEVGEEFMRIAEAFVFRRRVTQDFVDSIRSSKRQLDAKTARAGEAETNVKQGVGAIRDIEFSVQLLQLIAGGQHPELRVGATLPALAALANLEIISPAEGDMLAESYRFLRNVEHRLQIMDERPVRTLPMPDPAEMDRFARRLGYADGPSFLSAYQMHTGRVNRIFRDLFYGEGDLPLAPSEAEGAIRELLRGIEEPGAQDRMREELARKGFRSPDGALELLTRSEIGSDYGRISPDARASFEAIAGPLIDAAAATADPDLALQSFEQLSIATPSRAALHRTLAAEPLLLTRLLALATASPPLWQVLIGHLEYLDLLGDESQLDTPTSPPVLPPAPSEAGAEIPPPAPPEAGEEADHVSSRTRRPLAEGRRVAPGRGLDAGVREDGPRQQPLPFREGSPKAGVGMAETVAGYVRRERLRIGARDIWGLADTVACMADVTAMAENVLRATMRLPEVSEALEHVALIGMGKLGGAELGYGSDLDVLWVIEEGCDAEVAAAAARRVMAFIGADLKPYGGAFEIDARLRPDGRVGVLVRTADGYRRYLSESAQTWEKQALIKARFITGSESVGKAFVNLARGIVYGNPLDEAGLAEMRHMKHRIETERCKDPADIKLGPGGLSDIEWTVQMLQWRAGGRWRKAQAPGTLAALTALRDAAVVTQADWETLVDAYITLTELRNRRWLLTGGAGVSAGAVPGAVMDLRRRVREAFERLFLSATLPT